MAMWRTKSADALWVYVSRKGLTPLPKTSVSEWADNYRVISQGNAEPGRWRTSRAEYQREIMDAFTQAGIHRVVVKSAAQIGKSDVLPSEMIQCNDSCKAARPLGIWAFGRWLPFGGLLFCPEVRGGRATGVHTLLTMNTLLTIAWGIVKRVWAIVNRVQNHL